MLQTPNSNPEPPHRTLFAKTNYGEQQREFVIKGLTSDIMHFLIQFAYMRSVHITEENVEGLFAAASQFDLPKVTHLCCNFLEGQVCPDNCIGIYKFAQSYFCSDLEQNIFKFILVHFKHVVKSQEFLELSVDQLDQIISQDTLNVNKELVVFHAIVTWIGHHADSRKTHMERLFPKVFPVPFPVSHAQFLKIQIFHFSPPRTVATSSPGTCNQNNPELEQHSVESAPPPGILRPPRTRREACSQHRASLLHKHRSKHHEIDLHTRSISQLNQVQDCEPTQPGTGLSPLEIAPGLPGPGISKSTNRKRANGIRDKGLATRCDTQGQLFNPYGTYHSNILVCSQVRFGVANNDRLIDMAKCNEYVKNSKICCNILRFSRNARFMLNCDSILTRPRLPYSILFAFGGWNRGTPTNAIETYNTRFDTWVNVTIEEEAPRANFETAYLDGLIYVVGGFDSVNYFSDARCFDPVNCVWLQ
uniref:kelch-like protein 10 n=1 Tax=Myxine glutinosa TaxID=7769 RepID=UPI00358F7066